MKRNTLFLLNFSVFLTLLLTLLPGCGRILDWGKENFYQGKNFDRNFDVARSYIQSKRVYDQFTIVGHFDALWLSDEVRKIYTDFYAHSRGKTEEQKRIYFRRQLEENNHFISFYVLSLKDIILGDIDSVWTVSLKVGDKNFNPAKISTIDLSPEYLSIFGKKYNKFKDVYLIYFNAKDIEDNFIVSDKEDTISLVFRSVNKEVALSWCTKR